MSSEKTVCFKSHDSILTTHIFLVKRMENLKSLEETHHECGWKTDAAHLV